MSKLIKCYEIDGLNQGLSLGGEVQQLTKIGAEFTEAIVNQIRKEFTLVGIFDTLELL